MRVTYSTYVILPDAIALASTMWRRGGFMNFLQLSLSLSLSQVRPLLQHPHPLLLAVYAFLSNELSSFYPPVHQPSLSQ
jgi:hypothetical protein